MAAPLTPAEREEYGPLAYKMSLARTSAPEIASVLSQRAGHTISEKSVDRLIKAERAKRRQAREADDCDDLGQFLEEQDFAMAESIKRATAKGTSATAAANHLGNYISASVNKAKALGIFIERRDLTSGGKGIDQILDGILGRAVTFMLPDDINPFNDGD